MSEVAAVDAKLVGYGYTAPRAVRRSRELTVFGKLVLTVVTVCLGKCCFGV